MARSDISEVLSKTRQTKGFCFACSTCLATPLKLCMGCLEPGATDKRLSVEHLIFIQKKTGVIAAGMEG